MWLEEAKHTRPDCVVTVLEIGIEAFSRSEGWKPREVPSMHLELLPTIYKNAEGLNCKEGVTALLRGCSTWSGSLKVQNTHPMHLIPAVGDTPTVCYAGNADLSSMLNLSEGEFSLIPVGIKVARVRLSSHGGSCYAVKKLSRWRRGGSLAENESA